MARSSKESLCRVLYSYPDLEESAASVERFIVRSKIFTISLDWLNCPELS